MSGTVNNIPVISKPHLLELLKVLKLDKEFIMGEGNYLYSKKGKQTIKYLDYAGGYGSLLLGHNHPELIQKITELYQSKACSHHQLAKKPKLENLCREINQRIKTHTGSDYHITVLNTGSEAVEAAIKHALLGFNQQITSLEREINKNLISIRESYFNKPGGRELIIGSQVCSSVEDLRNYLNSVNELSKLRSNPVLIASNKSFHGKTLGALSITANPVYREPFASPNVFETVFISTAENALDELFNQHTLDVLIPRCNGSGEVSFKRRKLSKIAAVVLEPIIGEGGVHVTSTEFLSEVRALTQTHGIPLIFDEIQSGCYRSGPFLASFHYQVEADYYLIGKALGGGICKISALCISQNKYLEDFDLLHSSTFAEDDISSSIATESLRIMDRYSADAGEAASYLFSRLGALKSEFPKVIKEIRGKGLMIGISFKDFNYCNCYGLQGISRSPYFGYLLSAFLLNEKQIRVSVTLSDPYTIRLMPSMLIQQNEIDTLLDALHSMCHILENGDFYSLISFLLPEKFRKLRPVMNFYPDSIPLDDISDCKDEVGFLLHYIDVNTIREYVPSLAFLQDDIITYIIQILEPYSEPVIIGRNKITGSQGESIGVTFIGLSFTSKMVSDSMRASISNIRKYRDSCEKGIALLSQLGIRKIGLGQYTSIIMQNGKAISNPEIGVTSGNGYTVYAALMTAYNALNIQSKQEITIGIVGAGGNIGGILSYLLSEKADRLILLGREGSNGNKLMAHAGSLLQNLMQDPPEKCSSSLLKQISEYSSGLNRRKGQRPENHIDLWNDYSSIYKGKNRIQLGTDLNALLSCDLVMVATNDPTPFLKKEYFKSGTIICDISVPLNCDQELLEDEDITVVKGGIVDLPYGEKLCPRGLGLKKGEVYACMAETMLMGFSNGKGRFSFGDISKDQVLMLGERLREYGFNPGYKEEHVYSEEKLSH